MSIKFISDLPLLLVAGLAMLCSAPLAAQATGHPELPNAIGAYRDGDFARALNLWREACDDGNPRGCYHAAVVHRDGEGVPQDTARATALFEQACAGGFGNACFNLGHSASGSDQIAYFIKGCDLGNAGSCGRLGTAYRDGINVEQDLRKAVQYLTRGCPVGELAAGPACFTLASLYDPHLEETIIAEDPATANRWLDEGCARNHLDSCQNLAWHYAHGFGLKTDFVRSAALYQLACNDNAAFECFIVPAAHRASRPYSGREVLHWREAAGAYERACNADLAHGCFAMARLIAKSGNGAKYDDRMRELLNRAIALDPDHVAAIELLRIADAGELPASPAR